MIILRLSYTNEIRSHGRQSSFLRCCFLPGPANLPKEGSKAKSWSRPLSTGMGSDSWGSMWVSIGVGYLFWRAYRPALGSLFRGGLVHGAQHLANRLCRGHYKCLGKFCGTFVPAFVVGPLIAFARRFWSQAADTMIFVVMVLGLISKERVVQMGEN
jgi:hypothetical protein